MHSGFEQLRASGTIRRTLFINTPEYSYREVMIKSLICFKNKVSLIKYSIEKHEQKKYGGKEKANASSFDLIFLSSLDRF
jgi:hypothetical protein